MQKPFLYDNHHLDETILDHASLRAAEQIMSNDIHWLLELSVKPGKLNEFKVLMVEMIAATQKESGTLAYEWCFSADGKICNIYERYADSAAVLVHLGSFGKFFAERFLAAVTPSRFTVLGSPNNEVKAALAGFSPIYLAQEAGFARFAR